MSRCVRLGGPRTPMRYPQVLVYETDGRLARLLQGVSEAHGKANRSPEGESKLRHMIGGGSVSPFWLLEPRQPDECLAALARGGPSVLVLKLGRDLVNELDLLEQVSWRYPDVGSVVVCAALDPALAGLAWDLGASYVHSPQSIELLPGVVAGLLGMAIEFVPDSLLSDDEE